MVRHPYQRGNTPAAELVCSVENTRCPVSAACTPRLAVSLSRISPDHYYVWVLAQDTAQTISKRQTNVVINLDLVNAVYLILNRSSSVTMLIASVLISLISAYKLVDFTATSRAAC